MDTIIYFPYNDLVKKSSLASRDTQPEHVRNYDLLYGNNSWKPIADRYHRGAKTQTDKENFEQELVDLYERTLTDLDPNLSVKRIALQFPEMKAERTLYYLFLTTHDPTGAFVMNEVIDDAVDRQYLLRDVRQRTIGEKTQLSLFEVGLEDERRPVREKPNPSELDNLIIGRCGKSSMTFRDVLRTMVNEDGIYMSEVKSSLSRLRKGGKAKFSGTLRNDTSITFT